MILSPPIFFSKYSICIVQYYCRQMLYLQETWWQSVSVLGCGIVHFLPALLNMRFQIPAFTKSAVMLLLNMNQGCLINFIMKEMQYLVLSSSRGEALICLQKYVLQNFPLQSTSLVSILRTYFCVWSDDWNFHYLLRKCGIFSFAQILYGENQLVKVFPLNLQDMKNIRIQPALCLPFSERLNSIESSASLWDDIKQFLCYGIQQWDKHVFNK